ncbi:MAG TPA: hypothetical protein VNI83_01095 [Vicinamibacterales bacterium]|nr:hypothetical protein [Vicinamibacterales bacterium]
MTRRTRYFLAGSSLVLAVVSCAGLIAYYGGIPGLSASRPGPAELEYVPRDAAFIAYANIQDIMQSSVRQRLRERFPHASSGPGELERHTGIDFERDVEYVVAAAMGDGASEGGTFVIARGRFDTARLEALAREHGGRVEDYRGVRVLVGMRRPSSGRGEVHAPGEARPAEDLQGDRHGHEHTGALALLGPGLVAVGQLQGIRQAIDAQRSRANAITNADLMRLVADVEPASTAWAIGRAETLRSRQHMPDHVRRQLDAVQWFAASGQIDGGITGTIRAEARDAEAAENLRDVVRGLFALARLQAGSKPEWQAILQNLQLGGAGTAVTVSFTLPPDVIDLFAPTVEHKPAPQP